MFRAATLCLLFAACGAESTGIDVSALECPPDSTLTYETFGQTFIETNCLSCHASRERPRLGTVEEIRANMDDLLQETVATKAMPEDRDIDLEDRRLLGEWLACGAP